jgi:hypothetical protein
LAPPSSSFGPRARTPRSSRRDRRLGGLPPRRSAPRLPLPFRDGPDGPADDPRPAAARPGVPGLSSRADRPARRHARLRPRLPSWGLLPFGASVPEESGPHGLAEPATFRLQGFSPSCRFAPPRAVWACFVPQTPLGFPLQGLPLLSEVADSSPALSPPAVTSQRRGAGQPASGVCTRPGVRSRPQVVYACRRPMPSWVFRPLQGSTFPAMGAASHPLPSCASGCAPTLRRGCDDALRSRVFLRREDAPHPKARRRPS